MSKLDFLEKYAVEGRHYDIQKEIDKALDDSCEIIRESAIKHPSATEKNISKALDSLDWYTRLLAIRHPNLTEEHISKALNDSDEYVRKEATSKWSLKRIRTAQDSFK